MAVQEEGLLVRLMGDESSLEKATQAAAKSLDKVDKVAESTQKSLNQNAIVSNKVAKASQSMAKSSAQAGGAAVKSGKDFTGLSRVLQDLPYGFNAISNNLTNILPAAGAAGLAVSALTAGLVLAQIGFSAWTRGLVGSGEAADDLKEKIQQLREENENFILTLGTAQQVNITGSQNAQTDIVNLQTLYKASQDLNLPLEQRKRIVDQLQEQYPKYFANIKDETILAGGARTAYESLAQAITASARARAGQDVIVDETKNLLVLEQRITDNIQKRQKLEDAYRKQRGKEADLNLAPSVDEFGRIVQDTGPAAKLFNDINRTLAEGNELMNQRFETQKKINAVTSLLEGIIRETPDAILDPGADMTKGTGKVKAELDNRKKLWDDFVSYMKSLQLKVDFSFVPSTDKFSRSMDLLETEAALAAREVGTIFSKEGLIKEPIVVDEKDILLSTYKAKFAELGKKLPKLVPEFDLFGNRVGTKNLDLSAPIDEIKKALDIVYAETVSYADNIGTAIDRAMVSIGTQIGAGIGEAIGTALAGGNIGDVFKGLANSLGGVISQLGQQLIEIGVLAIVAKKALSNVLANPFASIAAGVALSALGAAIRTSLQPKKFAEGGLAFGPTLGLVGEGAGTTRRNPEVIAPLDKLKNFIGDAGGMQIIPQLKISGTDLIVVFNRAQKQLGRTN